MANIIKNKSAKTAKNVAIIMDGNGRWAISNSLNISNCLLYTSPSPRDRQKSRMPSSA